MVNFNANPRFHLKEGISSSGLTEVTAGNWVFLGGWAIPVAGTLSSLPGLAHLKGVLSL